MQRFFYAHGKMRWAIMSKKRRESTSMPASSAGLMRFFQDEAHGVKIGPEIVIASAIALIIAVILAHTIFPAASV